MSEAISTTSQFGNQGVVMVDPWSVNPLLEDAQQSVPALVELARKTGGDPPTLFESGDAPPFMASGVDPRYLAVLPWKVRHAAAMESDPGRVLAYVEDYANEPDANVPTPGLAAYISRFGDWLSGRWINPAFAGISATDHAASESDFYDSMFGAQDAAASLKRAAVNKQDAALRASRQPPALGHATR
jgi:hypothetical protein